jgi:hypothetical protein
MVRKHSYSVGGTKRKFTRNIFSKGKYVRFKTPKWRKIFLEKLVKEFWLSVYLESARGLDTLFCSVNYFKMKIIPSIYKGALLIYFVYKV